MTRNSDLLARVPSGPRAETVEEVTAQKESRTTVVNRRRAMFDVYIGRPSKWGNPFSHMDGTLAKFKVSSRQEAVDKYREWILSQPELVATARRELAGKVLGCWCKPASCHGDVLAAIANGAELPKEVKCDA